MTAKSRIIGALVLVNVLWAGNPVMQKFLLADFAPLQVAWLRIVVGTLVLAGVWPWARRTADYELQITNGNAGGEHPQRTRGRLWLRAVAMGAVVFFVTPLLITYGLNASLAVHNAFITGLEPVITIVLARIFLGERMRTAGWAILAVALSGFALLSGVGGEWDDLLAGTYLAGNLLLLAGMVGEAMYSIVGAPLAKRMPPVTVFLIALATGAALLSVFLVASGALPSIGQFTARSAIGLLWTGPITTTFCYLVWLTSLRHVPVQAAAFTLFIQPLIGAVMGYALLGERLEGLQVAGATLILASLVMYVRRLR